MIPAECPMCGQEVQVRVQVGMDLNGRAELRPILNPEHPCWAEGTE